MNSQTQQPQLSVVIVNYNTRTLLRACLRSLVKQPTPVEIIVVDNDSNDGSAVMVADLFPEVKLLAQDKNHWFCGGNNIGIDASTCDFVLLLNPDTVVASDTLGLMLQFMMDHPDYAGCTAQMRYPNGTIQRTCSRVPSLSYLFANHTPMMLRKAWHDRLNAHHWYGGWDRNSDQDVDVVPGSCTLMRREDIYLDDDLRLYFPEDDLARRIKKPFRFLAPAHITHHEKASTQNWSATKNYYRDLFIYTRKHHGWPVMVLLWLMSRPVYWGMWWKNRQRNKLASAS